MFAHRFLAISMGRTLPNLGRLKLTIYQLLIDLQVWHIHNTKSFGWIKRINTQQRQTNYIHLNINLGKQNRTYQYTVISNQQPLPKSNLVKGNQPTACYI